MRSRPCGPLLVALAAIAATLLLAGFFFAAGADAAGLGLDAEVEYTMTNPPRGPRWDSRRYLDHLAGLTHLSSVMCLKLGLGMAPACFQQAGDQITIVAKSTTSNHQRVIRILEELYG